jgi:hypothetical protein
MDMFIGVLKMHQGIGFTLQYVDSAHAVTPPP